MELIYKEKRSLLLLLFAFFTSFAASGALPLIGKELTGSNVNSSLGFLPYFLFQLLGQLSIVKFDSLRLSKKTLLGIMSLFTLSIVLLPIVFRFPPTTMIVSLFLIRAIEGLSVGIGIPLIYELIVKSKFHDSIDRRLVILNFANMSGFVFGIPVSEGWTELPISFLNTCGIILGCLTFIEALLQTQAQPCCSQALHSSKTQEYSKTPSYKWILSGFYLFFISKTFYGYLISHLMFQKSLFSLSYFWITFVLAGISIFGQIIASVLASNFKESSLEVYIPTLWSVGLVGLILSPSTLSLSVVVMIHSMVYFLGTRKAALFPESAKEYARMNGLSDPGVVLGSLLPIFTQNTSLAIILILALGPAFFIALHSKQPR